MAQSQEEGLPRSERTWRGMMCARASSITVTSLPKRRYICANSSPVFFKGTLAKRGIQTQTQGERCAALAFSPNRLIDQPAGCLAQLGDKIDRIAFAVEPACALPAGPGLRHRCRIRSWSPANRACG